MLEIEYLRQLRFQTVKRNPLRGVTEMDLLNFFLQSAKAVDSLSFTEMSISDDGDEFLYNLSFECAFPIVNCVPIPLPIG